MQNRTLLTLGAVALLGVCALGYRLSTGGGGTPAPTSSARAQHEPPPVPTQTSTPTSTTASPPPSAASSAEDPGAKRGVLLSARWGSGRGALGHARPNEGNAEGPMSFALAGDEIVVVDQVNGRVVRYDKSGRVTSTSDVPVTVQDVAVAPDGTTVLLDKLGEKTLTLTDPNGRRVGELSLRDPRVGDPGLLTGVFVDGKDVYVEKEHGALVKVGDTDGKAAGDDAPQLTGRPSKDGVLVLTAGFQSQPAGRAWLNAFDRKKGALRFARAIQFPRPGHSIVLLDTDAKGTIYLGAWAGDGHEVTITCLDPGDGHPLGRVVTPISATPEESLRDFAVGADGTIVYALRSDDGVELHTARCP